MSFSDRLRAIEAAADISLEEKLAANLAASKSAQAFLEQLLKKPSQPPAR